MTCRVTVCSVSCS